MAYDERLAARVRVVLKGPRALVEKKMFGGLAYLSNGKMFAGILNKDLVVRVGPEEHDKALRESHTRPMDFTGKPMAGFLYVDAPGLKTERQLSGWIAAARAFIQTLPARKVGTTVRKTRRARTLR